MSEYTTPTPKDQGGFVLVPISWHLGGRPKELKNDSLALVLLVIASVWQSGRDFTCSNEWITKVTGIPGTTVKRHIVKLQELGYISFHKAPNVGKQGFKRVIICTKNIYGVSGNDLLLSFHDAHVDKDGNTTRGKDPMRFEMTDPFEEG